MQESHELHESHEPSGSPIVVDQGPLPIVPLAVAAIAAAVGVGAWGLLIHITGYEIGFLAWGIGVFVGVAATAVGGRGVPLAVLCAVLAVGSIAGGKLFGAHLVIEGERDTIVTEATAQGVYEEFLEDAQLVQGLETPTELKGFMIERNFTNASAVPDVDSGEYLWFTEETLPALNAANASPPTYEAWRSDQEADIDEFLGDVSLIEAVKEGLSPIDLLFAVLGLVSAFKIVAGGRRS